MRISNEQKQRAKEADLIAFMNEHHQDRLIKDGKSWRDSEYRDITIWFSDMLDCYKWKAHKKETEEINPQVVGTDTIAYLRKYLGYSFEQAVTALAEYKKD